jgi:hypothetical protein
MFPLKCHLHRVGANRLITLTFCSRVRRKSKLIVNLEVNSDIVVNVNIVRLVHWRAYVASFFLFLLLSSLLLLLLLGVELHAHCF